MHSPRFPESLIEIELSENVEERYKGDVVVIQFGIATQHRFFSFGEGIRGMRPTNEQNDEVCDATNDDSDTNDSYINKRSIN